MMYLVEFVLRTDSTGQPVPGRNVSSKSRGTDRMGLPMGGWTGTSTNCCSGPRKAFCNCYTLQFSCSKHFQLRYITVRVICKQINTVECITYVTCQLADEKLMYIAFIWHPFQTVMQHLIKYLQMALNRHKPQKRRLAKKI